ncbi:DUF3078 domain-containing protein [candidate division GN15 bacterium]|nr:DUF3078 domain-containing protein [candidate division GN15 bacterium]
MQIYSKLFWSVVWVCLLAISGSVAARDAADDTTYAWKKSLVFSLLAAQTSYNDAWTGGEVGSFSWQSNLNGMAQRQFTDVFHLKSTLKLSFGQTSTQDEATGDWSEPSKSTDEIDWESVGSFTMHKFVDPYVAFRLESQFFDGRYNNRVFLDSVSSNTKLWFSPLRLTESAGATRMFYEKDDDFISSRLGFAFRQTFQSYIDTTDVALPQVDSTFNDGGLESVTDAALTLSDKLQYTTKLTLYKAIFFSESDQVKGTPAEDDWKTIDVDWENMIAAQVSKVVTVSFYAQFLYDKQVEKRGRLKQTLALGITYRLF